MKEKLMWTGIGVLIGLVFAPQIQKIPLLNKIPQV
jgi:hypothetical protein